MGSLARVPRVYAAVHGWAPGSQSAADLIHAQTGNEPRAWDDGMVDLFGFSIADSFIPLLSAIAGSDPDAAVLWFSWVDESATAGEVFAGRESLKRLRALGAAGCRGASTGVRAIGWMGGRYARVAPETRHSKKVDRSGGPQRGSGASPDRSSTCPSVNSTEEGAALSGR